MLTAVFTFIDFLPECRDPGGIFSNPEFETFRTLIDRANNWLRVNPKWEIITCESIEFKAKRDDVNSEKMVYLEYGETSTSYIRGLRLWITGGGNEKEKQIGYINIIPEQENDGGIFSSPAFETLDEVVSRFNKMIQTRPIPGITDFTPDTVTRGGVFSLPQYELFSSVVEKASDWCARQAGIRFVMFSHWKLRLKQVEMLTRRKWISPNMEEEPLFTLEYCV
ncbi:uncharacterized protein CEXT_354161 [Caerostris extrusa]|uniref:Uncharacterized protein n=1 Tax=Caerostris extrusa TaxID=172846 RepID=A0AAV4Q8J0_CAEEX|nr:uncharacterized protein CEXT_354161 [Caerostris extrusa]